MQQATSLKPGIAVAVAEDWKAAAAVYGMIACSVHAYREAGDTWVPVKPLRSGSESW